MLRLYRWSPPALSLGRFQCEDDVDADACARFGVDVVRRPTGGKAVLHGADLTYSVVMPRPRGAAGSVDGVYAMIAPALIAGLARIGVEASVARHDAAGSSGPASGRASGPVCFTSMQGADLRVGERKLCGSAQMRYRGSVPERRGGAALQHGSILLDRLAFDETALLRGGTPQPLAATTVTLRELGAPADPFVVAGALVEGFRETLDVDFSFGVGVGSSSPCS